jgi:hypothetical protein
MNRKNIFLIIAVALEALAIIVIKAAWSLTVGVTLIVGGLIALVLGIAVKKSP